MSFAKRFKQLRGIETQKAFAEKLGITPQAVLNYEKYGRIPKGRYLANICQRLGVREQWLLTGEGPVYLGEGVEKTTADMSALLPLGKNEQRIENIDPESTVTADMSAVTVLRGELAKALKNVMAMQDRLLAAQERIASLLEEKAELQVALERVRMDVERRDQRIRELEKENAQLREARKGTAYPGAGIAGGAG